MPKDEQQTTTTNTDAPSLADQHHDALRAWLKAAEAYRDLSPELQASEARQAVVRAARRTLDEIYERIKASNNAQGFIYNN